MINENLKNKIIQILIDEKRRPIPKGILFSKVNKILNLKYKSDFYNLIDEMSEKGEIKLTFHGNCLLGYINGEIFKNELFEGKIFVNNNGDGYIKTFDENNILIQEYFVFIKNLNGALDKDIVKFYKMDKKSLNLIGHAIVESVGTRYKEFFVYTFLLTGNNYSLICDDRKNYYKVKLDSIDELVNRNKILVQIKEFGKDGIAYGAVSKILGYQDDIGMDIVSIINGLGIETDFSQESIEIAKSSKINEDDNVNIRRDITNWNLITIDPPTSKDLDDAFYLEKRKDHYFLSVSIADVCDYVPLESALDKEAQQRGTSVYLIDRVIPMLPHYLSNKICSLNPNEARMAVTCDMQIDFSGEILNIEVYPSKIKTKNRFSYDEVNEFFETNKIDCSEETRKLLIESRQLHHILRAKKHRDGYINFNIDEPIIKVDKNLFPIAILVKKSGIAQRMIEDFMVSANQSVTKKAAELKMPFIYRVHKKPEIKKLKKLAIEAMKIDFKIKATDFENINSKTLVRWIDDNKDHPAQMLINKLLLRCMSKAEYSTINDHHFGLSLEDYTHFTSPIRRYPDIIVHRLFWIYYFNPKAYTDKQRSSFKAKLQDLCILSNQQEIKAVTAERDVNSLKFAQFLSTKVGEIFDGIISTVTAFGMFVELENTIEGLVHLKNIGKDFYKYDEGNLTIRGEKTGRTFTFGQQIQIRVLRVDVILRQIDFEIVGLERENKFK